MTNNPKGINIHLPRNKLRNLFGFLGFVYLDRQNKNMEKYTLTH